MKGQHICNPTSLISLVKNLYFLSSSTKFLLPQIFFTKSINFVQARYKSCEENPKPEKKQTLLKFPALKLEQTIPTFLKSVQPLLNYEEFEEAKRQAKHFSQEEGAKLQKLLEEVAAKEENWLAPRWLKVAYLGYRAPVTVYSSPGMTLPLAKFKNKHEYLVYASKLIVGFLKFKKRIDDGKIPVAKMGKYELDNSQFEAVFGTCRIPLPEIDGLQFNPKSQHVIIIHKNHFYKLPVYNNTGQILHFDLVAKQIEEIVNNECEFGFPIGLLSTDDRDNWAKSYKQLIQNHTNCKNIQIIQKSLFTVSLDQEVAFDEANKYDILGQQLVHGGGTEQNSANRWMDKTIQVIVNPNGMSGICYEHSPAEGQPIAMMTDFITKILSKEEEFKDGASDDYERYTKIEFLDVELGLRSYINLATRNINCLASDMHLYVKHFKNYGKEFLKKQKLSPDSFIQTALQYGFYKLHKSPAAQYESAHLRIFYGGRTETIRSCSNESLAFCRAMLDPQGCNRNRRLLMREAVKGHRSFTNKALLGQGVDRHLLGLKLMAIENNMLVPAFFSSKAFLISSHFRISTSQVATPNKAFMCYGAPVKDGYACCYNPRDNDIFLACSSWKSNETTNAKQFADSISLSLNEMHDLIKKEQIK